MIKLSKSNEDFKTTFQEYLNKHELEMQLFFRNFDSNIPLEKNQIRGGIYHDDKLVTIFLNAYPFNVIIFNLTNDESLIKIALEELISYIKDNQILIRGCQSDYQTYLIFKSLIQKYFNKEMEVKYSMDIMRLNKVNFFSSEGEIKRATLKDKDFIKSAYIKFNKEALGEETDDQQIDSLIEDIINNSLIYVYKNKFNEVTSCVKALVNLPHGVTLNFVYTDIKYRNHGYAKNMISLICQQLIKQKEYITLFVDKTNPISNKVYLDVGFDYFYSNYDCRVIM